MVPKWQLTISRDEAQDGLNYYLRDTYADGKRIAYIFDYERKYSPTDDYGQPWKLVRRRKKNADGSWAHNAEFGSSLRKSK